MIVFVATRRCLEISSLKLRGNGIRYSVLEVATLEIWMLKNLPDLIGDPDRAWKGMYGLRGILCQWVSFTRYSERDLPPKRSNDTLV